MTLLLLSVSLGLAVANGAVAAPCCKTCQAGKQKYFSIPHPEDANSECGECCLEPRLFRFWKVFEPKLQSGLCASQGYTQYTKTETDGVWPLEVASDRYIRDSGRLACTTAMHAVYADMHDGDMKEVKISGSSMTIKPSGNNQTWVVNAVVDPKSCSAGVDFNVKGKPGPPPVSLMATLWNTRSYMEKKSEFGFTDPSGTLAAPDFPLNQWVELGMEQFHGRCRRTLHAVYADMHDGDKKEVTISGTSMKIKPSGNNQTWVVNTVVDRKSCSAMVDFNVPGKPSPPAVKLMATLFESYDLKARRTEFEFTDPSGTLAAADFPLNRWVEISGTNVGADIVI